MGTDNLNVTRTLVAEQGDGADRAALPDWQATRRRETRPRASLRPQAWLTLCVLSALVLAALGAFLYQQWLVLDLQAPQLTFAVRVLLLVGVPVLGLIGLWQWLQVRAQQARIVRMENDHPVSIEAVLSGRLPVAESLAAFYQVQGQWAAHSGFRSLNQLDMSSTKAAEKPADVPQLPAPTDAPGNRLTFEAFWRRLTQEETHIAALGLSRAGKSTLGRALLNEYLARGDQVMVMSLAADRVDWPVPVIGDGGEAVIVQAIGAIRAELHRRELARERDGVPIHIFVDELTSATADKAVYEAWAGVMAAFMTRSRHVQMYLVVMAHDNTSGVFAAAGKARLIRNFCQVWCVRDKGQRIIRIDDGISLDDRGRPVRQVWQLDDTAPIAERANRHIRVPEGAIFLTEDSLRSTTPTTRDAPDLRLSYTTIPSYASYGLGNGMPNVVDDVVEDWECPFCGAPLRNRQQFSIAHRYGWCDVCKPEGVE